MAILTTIAPHGGRLVDLLAGPERARELAANAPRWPGWALTRRQRCDLELLACGGFSPLRGFLGEDDHRSVVESMRLADGTVWPMPVTLDLPDPVAGPLVLYDTDASPIAVLHVTEAWRPDRYAEAEFVFGTTDPAHPGVDHLLHHSHPWYVSGDLEVLRLPAHRQFAHLRRTPAQVRAEFARRGWQKVVAFQTRNPMHRAHQALTLRATRETGAQLMIHPVVGVTKPGDVDAYTRVRCYQALLPAYPDGTVLLSLLPLAMRMGGPREALWHAIIRMNYGATHFIVGRDHAGPGPGSDGQPFYHPYDAQRLLSRYATELGITILPYQRMVYLADHDRYVQEDEAPPGARVLAISGTQLRRRLAEGADLPHWFTPPEVAAELRRPP